tara:strand:- start:397 stop:765 length:369 start_codon:yes stop_codon:yes gene_type:complete
MFKNKRGQGLSMNVVVVAILAVIILVILALIFTGGIGKVWGRIGTIFRWATPEEQSLEFAEKQCELACSNAQAMSKENVGRSTYCKQTFNIDASGDGEIEENVHCWDLNVPCPGVETSCSER